VIELYFAYGSNMSLARLRARIPEAQSLGAARLPGHGLRIDKLGRDRSAKANLVIAAGEEVWGVLYRMPHEGFARLDRHEGGYVRFEADVEDAAGALRRALSYRSERRADDPRPFAWYRAHMLAGAREHGLPEAWIQRLEAIAVRPDPATGDRRGE
jgi:gamma-glutamylcyclotransferase